MPEAPDRHIAYLDHAASTPMRPEAVASMVAVLEQVPGNPSGQHAEARRARRRLDDARDQVAAVVGCEPGEVVFTSGGTEADNLAIRGVVEARGGAPRCLATDHHAAIEPVLAGGGTRIEVHDRGGAMGAQVAQALVAEPGASVVSLAAVNNEVGFVEPVDEVAEAIRRSSGALVHVDAVAAAGWLDLRPIWAAADLLSLSGHKVGGPKGIGVLVVRDGTPLAPLLRGGAQERERRAGTQNVAGAVAMAAALEAAEADRPAMAARVAALRGRLHEGLLAALGSHAHDTAAERPGHDRAPHLVHLCLWGVHRDALLFRLDEEGVAASAGSSCASGASEPSHVVEALGLPDGLRQGALRLSLGWTSTSADVDRALEVVPAVVAALAGTEALGGVRP